MVEATDAAEAAVADMAVVASAAVVVAAREKSGLKKICTRMTATAGRTYGGSRKAMPVQRAEAVAGTQAVSKPKEQDRQIRDQP